MIQSKLLIRINSFDWIISSYCYNFSHRKALNLMGSVTKKWLFLKVSSAILLPLMLWFSINLASVYDKGYNELLLFITSQPSKFLFSLFLIFAYFFSALSISEVFEDYIEDEKIKNAANKSLNIFAIVFPLIIIILVFNI